MANWIRYFFRRGSDSVSNRNGYQLDMPLSKPINSAMDTVTEDTALQISTTWNCIDLIARTIACLPIHVYKVDNKGVKTIDNECNLHELLSIKPNSLMTPYDFFHVMTMHRMLRGNAYALISRDSKGVPFSLIPLDPDGMSVIKKGIEVRYQYSSTDGNNYEYTSDDILHWKGLGNGVKGLSTLDFMRANITESAKSSDNAIDIFSNKGKMNGIISTQAQLNYKQKEEISEQFNRMRVEGGIPVLPANISFTPLSLSPADTQLLQTRKFNNEDICRWFGVPYQLISCSDSANYEQIERVFYKTTILPLCISLEQAIINKIACKNEKNHKVSFMLDVLNRANDKDRYSLYAQAVQNGILTRNECRQKEGLSICEGGDVLTAQTNLAPLEQLGNFDPSQTSQTQLVTDPIKQ